MIEPTEQEKRILAEAGALKLLMNSHGWKLLRDVMKQWESEGLNAMSECRSSDDRIRVRFQDKWEERKNFNKMVDTYFERVLEARLEILRSIAEQNGASAVDAFNLTENL